MLPCRPSYSNPNKLGGTPRAFRGRSSEKSRAPFSSLSLSVRHGPYLRERNEHVGTGVSLANHTDWEKEKPLSALAPVSCACGWLKRPGVFGSRLAVFGEETPV